MKNDPLLERYRFEWQEAREEGLVRDMARILKDLCVHVRRHYGLDHYKLELSKMCDELDDLIKDASRKDFLAGAAALSFVKSRLQSTGTQYGAGLAKKPTGDALRQVRRLTPRLHLKSGNPGEEAFPDSEFGDQ
jgi:hypothetical protein